MPDNAIAKAGLLLIYEYITTNKRFTTGRQETNEYEEYKSIIRNANSFNNDKLHCVSSINN